MKVEKSTDNLMIIIERNNEEKSNRLVAGIAIISSFEENPHIYIHTNQSLFCGDYEGSAFKSADENEMSKLGWRKDEKNKVWVFQ